MSTPDDANTFIFSLHSAVADDGAAVPEHVVEAGFQPLESAAPEEAVFSDRLILPEASTNQTELWLDTVADPDVKAVNERAVRVKARLDRDGMALRDVDSAKSIVQLLNELVEESEQRTFFLYDLGTVIRKYDQWIRYLPRVKPHYAIKCNPDPIILRTLQECGAGFDCASEGEFQAVIDIGANPQDIIYANPCKQIRSIEMAKKKGVKRMTFDNKAELEKIAKVYPEAELVVRIKPPVEKAVMSFSRKFGATTSVAIGLVKRAKALGVQCVGVSFHVGSGCYSIDAYLQTLQEARKIFDAAAALGQPMNLLDIGGGWPGVDGEKQIGGHIISFPAIASQLAPLLDEMFPPEVEIISEPGRYFVTECAILCVNIIAKRTPASAVNSDSEGDEDAETAAREGDGMTYYISDGVYGSFNAIHYDYMEVKPNVLPSKEAAAQPAPSEPAPEKPQARSTLFGPTCDSMDIVCTCIDLPEMDVGDWLYFYNMGAYTKAAASSFNGFPLPTCHYYISQ